MKLNNKLALISIVLSLITLTSFSLTSAYKISEEEISKEELIKRVDNFNKLYHEMNPFSKDLELKVEDDNRIRLHTLKDLTDNESYIKFNRENLISSTNIYKTKFEEAISEIEENYGFDDMMNFALFILHEKFNPESKWKAYVDLFPAKPENLVFDFWNTKNWAENILKGTTVISKLFLNK